MWMPVRSYEREYLDDHEPEQSVVDRIYWFLAAINRYLGGTAATLKRFEQLSDGWPAGARIRILDVASGAADVPRGIIAWGRSHGYDIRVTALDVSKRALSYARRSGSPEALSFVCADVNQMPFADGTFDYVTCALFFHHLKNEQIVAALREFSRVGRGIVVNDLQRKRRLYFWTTLFTFPFHWILRNDGRLSVKRSLLPHELQALANAAGTGWLSVQTHFGHRMTLAGEKPATGQSSETRVQSQSS